MARRARLQVAPASPSRRRPRSSSPSRARQSAIRRRTSRQRTSCSKTTPRRARNANARGPPANVANMGGRDEAAFAGGRAVEAARADADGDRVDRPRGTLMGLLAWVMMGLAIWHFTIFMPDRFWGGIVGAFLGSLAGAVVVATIICSVKASAFKTPGQNATDIAVVLYAVPGALIGIAAVYLEGIRRERLIAQPASRA